MYNTRPEPGNLANFSLILEVSIHVLDYRRESLEYGNHSKIHLLPDPPDIGGLLQTEFQTQKGKIIVSRKSCVSTIIPLANRMQSAQIRPWPIPHEGKCKAEWTSVCA